MLATGAVFVPGYAKDSSQRVATIHQHVPDADNLDVLALPTDFLK